MWFTERNWLVEVTNLSSSSTCPWSDHHRLVHGTSYPQLVKLTNLSWARFCPWSDHARLVHGTSCQLDQALLLLTHPWCEHPIPFKSRTPTVI